MRELHKWGKTRNQSPPRTRRCRKCDAHTHSRRDATEAAAMKPPAINCTNRICAKPGGPLQGQKPRIGSEPGGADPTCWIWICVWAEQASQTLGAQFQPNNRFDAEVRGGQICSVRMHAARRVALDGCGPVRESIPAPNHDSPTIYSEFCHSSLCWAPTSADTPSSAALKPQT